MTRFKIWCSVALLLALLVIGGAIISNPATASNNPPPPKHPVGKIFHSTFHLSQTYVDGIPAISVHSSPGSTLRNPSTPAFSENDVVAFLNKYGFYAGPLVQGAHLKIVFFQFVTAKQASDLMQGESVGRPDNYLVCYVKVRGPFLLTNVSMFRLPNGQSQSTAEFGDMVFDGHTGNDLVWGV
ncbi:MAG: hypothetical protein H0W02_21500 [Ktedonobacteraceae bacterium]|nr:hypothetical protein [Ktedonobacteraceae bacterium]